MRLGLNRTGTLSRCKTYTTWIPVTYRLLTFTITHIITYTGKYPALPWLPTLLHPVSSYPTVAYTISHPDFTLSYSAPGLIQIRLKRLTTGAEMAQSRKDSDCQDRNDPFSSVHCQTSTTLMTSLVNTH